MCHSKQSALQESSNGKTIAVFRQDHGGLPIILVMFWHYNSNTLQERLFNFERRLKGIIEEQNKSPRNPMIPLKLRSLRWFVNGRLVKRTLRQAVHVLVI